MNQEIKDLQPEISGDRIKIKVDGVDVEGRFALRERTEMMISITKPYSGLVVEAGHIPIAATGTMNYQEAYGEKKAIVMLRDIYHFCCCVHKTPEKLKRSPEEQLVAVQYSEHPEPQKKQSPWKSSPVPAMCHHEVMEYLLRIPEYRNSKPDWARSFIPSP